MPGSRTEQPKAGALPWGDNLVARRAVWHDRNLNPGVLQGIRVFPQRLDGLSAVGVMTDPPTLGLLGVGAERQPVKVAQARPRVRSLTVHARELWVRSGRRGIDRNRLM